MKLDVEKEYREMAIRYRLELFEYIKKRQQPLTGDMPASALSEMARKLEKDYAKYTAAEFPSSFLKQLNQLCIRVQDMTEKKQFGDQNAVKQLEAMVSAL